MIYPLLERFGETGRYDADPVATVSVRNKQQSAFDHAGYAIPILAIVLAPVGAGDGEGIAKGDQRHFE
jgi:hypothetical protein